MTGTPKAIDWDGQRAHLVDLRDKIAGELRDLAERRKGLALDLELGIGNATKADLEVLEQTMADKTAARDRLRDSLIELDGRQAASEAATAAAARRALEKQVEDRLQRLGALGGQMADCLKELRRLLADVAALEHETAQLAGQLHLQLPRGGSRKNVLARALVGLQVALPTYFVSPDEGLAAEERLRQTPVLTATFGHAVSEPARVGGH
jgi:hypothetical protein